LVRFDVPAPLYRGSCLCGSVRYEVQLDARPEASVHSVWEQTVRPRHFKLLSGEDTLSGHQFGGDQTQHFFCERCGERSFSHHVASTDGAFYSVDLKSLERARAPQVSVNCASSRGPALC
jgi:hypothetical protein